MTLNIKDQVHMFTCLWNTRYCISTFAFDFLKAMIRVPPENNPFRKGIPDFQTTRQPKPPPDHHVNTGGGKNAKSKLNKLVGDQPFFNAEHGTCFYTPIDLLYISNIYCISKNLTE